ncbi:MAG: hypothetical protein ABIO52_00405, partial [Gemmatimonadaceae bacterium]
MAIPSPLDRAPNAIETESHGISFAGSHGIRSVEARGQFISIDHQLENDPAGGLRTHALLTRPTRAPDSYAEAAALRRLSALLTG